MIYRLEHRLNLKIFNNSDIERHKLSELKVLPDLRFKGERTYIHGTDLFQSITQVLNIGNSGYLKDVSFRSFANKQCIALFCAPDSSDTEIICQGRWHDNEKNSDVRFWVVEQGAPISERYEFDEEALCSGAEFTESLIINKFNSEFSMIENIVALTKKFHNKKLPLFKGKWVFGQIFLNQRLPNSSSQIQIENYQNIKDRFSRNRIVLDEKSVGEIRFVVA